MGIKNKLIYIVAIVFIFCSCNRVNNPKERNIIVFNDTIDSVAKAIASMNNILNNSNVINNFFYAIDREILFVKGPNNKSQEVGFIKDTILYQNKTLSFIDTLQRVHFIEYAEFLKNNFLTRCDKENSNYVYLYRADIYMADKQKDMMRYIMLTNSVSNIDLNKYKIIDSKEDLFLLAEKDAEIYESQTNSSRQHNQ
jgi:hypothetical protein